MPFEETAGLLRAPRAAADRPRLVVPPENRVQRRIVIGEVTHGEAVAGRQRDFELACDARAAWSSGWPALPMCPTVIISKIATG